MSLAEFIPISSLSAIHRSLAYHLMVTIQAYCDGSGKVDDPRARFLTLVGVIAAVGDWKEFEERWDGVLTRHHSPPWHSADANALRKDFVGWTDERVLAVKADLFNTCFSGIGIPRGFICGVCTLDLGDYKRAADQLPAIRDIRPEAFCAFRIAGIALDSLPNNPDASLRKDGVLELFFDMNEPFRHHIEKEWGARKKDRWGDILSRIVSIASVDHRQVLGIQAADLLAWHTNRGYVTGDKTASFYSRMAMRFLRQEYWDYDGLIAAFTEKLVSGT